MAGIISIIPDFGKVVLIHTINKNINGVLGYISKTDLFGWLPLDNLLHFSFGTVLTIFILRKKNRPFMVFFMVMAIELLKEFYDSFGLRFTYQEAAKDLAYTMIYPTLAIIVSLIKKYINRREL